MVTRDLATTDGQAPAGRDRPSRPTLAWRGARNATAAFSAWRKADDYKADVDRARDAKEVKVAELAKSRHEAMAKARAQFLANLLRVASVLLAGGWWPLVVVHVTGTVLAVHLWGEAKEAAAKERALSAVKASGTAAVVAVLVWLVNFQVTGWTLHWHWVNTAWMAGTILLAMAWFLRSVWDGDVGNDLPTEEMAPVEVERDDTPPIIRAVLTTGKLKAGAEPRLVQPGIVYRNSGTIWQGSLDTGGQSATVFLKQDAREELAAQLDLSGETLLLKVDRKRGQRLHLTGIVGDPFAEEVQHPLLTRSSVDLWQPFPFGLDVTGSEVSYTVPGVNSLFGGESGAGKSVAVFDVIAAFALSPTSKIYAIDGGEADTKVLYKTGLADAWTSERKDALEILAMVKAEVDRRQRLLGDAGDDVDVKVSPELMAEHGFGFDLLMIDELASFTQDKSDEAKKFNELLLPIVQRARKTGFHLLLSTQSPSRDAIDPDARDVISTRWCGRARSPQLANKVLGQGAIGLGLNPKNLPDVEGIGWLSGPRVEVVVRPYYLSKRERRTICDRGVALRQASGVPTVREVGPPPEKLLAALEIVRASGQPSMRSEDLAARLDTTAQRLLAEIGVKSRQESSDGYRKHVHLADLEETVRRHGRPLRVVS